MSNEVKKTKVTLLNNKVYLAGKEIIGLRPIYYAVQTVFGIGPTRAKFICLWLKEKFNVEQTHFIGNLNDNIIKDLNDFISISFTTEGDLKKSIDENINTKIKIQCREGKRLNLGLPLHGRTKSNGATAKKKRRKT